jgi:hypothetical protein
MSEPAASGDYYSKSSLVAIYGPNEDNPEFFKRLLFNLNQGLCSQKYPKICLKTILDN